MIISRFPATSKKNDVDEHLQMSIDVALLYNRPSGIAGLPFV
jgi:hypothetical protein